MSDRTEVTAKNLKLLRVERDLSQQEVADILGITGNQISKIESGGRALADAEKKLLDWFFFGNIPARLTEFPADTRGLLEFDEAEWRIIEILASRAGMAPRKWIGEKVREYLAIFQATPPEPVAVPAKLVAVANSVVPFEPVSDDDDPLPIRFPIIRRGSVAAGGKSSADLEEVEIGALKKYPSGHYALRVDGQSMEPTIPDGSTIVVRAFKDQGYPRAGTIVVYNDGHGTTLKLFDRQKPEAGTDAEHASLGKIPVLKSINPDFPDVEPLEGGRIDAVLVEILE